MIEIERRVFRVVGGNDSLLPMKRVSREARWPPLRIVGPHTSSEQAVEAKRRTSGLMWMAGLVMAILQGVGQSISDHYW
jgi:hypothetical protein